MLRCDPHLASYRRKHATYTAISLRAACKPCVCSVAKWVGGGTLTHTDAVQLVSRPTAAWVPGLGLGRPGPAEPHAAAMSRPEPSNQTRKSLPVCNRDGRHFIFRNRRGKRVLSLNLEWANQLCIGSSLFCLPLIPDKLPWSDGTALFEAI